MAGNNDPPVAAAGERRQMTVMFCDIVGSTRISELLDPEQTREILLKFQDVVAAPVRRYDGFIAQYLGDGLLVYFGYPRAHEDAARRALFAGLEVTEAVRALSPEIESRFHVKLDVRVGIHSGEVVVGEMRGGGTGAIGPTPNLAARLQDLAAPNSVVTSAFTRGLVEGYFEFQDLGRHQLKGVTDEMALYQVVAPTGVMSRLETSSVLSPLVGRPLEQRLLEERWSSAAAGKTARPLLLLGEAGLGKSRLVRFIRAYAGRAGGICIDGSASPYNTGTPFYAILQIIEQGCGIFAGDSPSVRLEKLAKTLSIYGMPDDASRVLASLLSIPPEGRYEPLMLSPEAFRALVIDTLEKWLDMLTEQAPVLLVVEDLHWADDSTLALLAHLMSNPARVRCLILVTSRSELGEHSLPDEALEVHRLGPLEEAGTQEMLDWLLAGHDLAPGLSRQLLERSNGVPLFIEELARTYRVSGRDMTAIGGAVPETLRDLLSSRLEAPGIDKELAQISATIGTEAPLSLLEAVTGHDRETLQQRLEGLIAAGIMERSPGSALESCSFRHALVRDEAYLTQLLSQRAAVHGRIAEAMERGVGGPVRPEVLGLHCMQAQRWESAAAYYVEAGTQAHNSGAETEAIRQFSEALRAAEAQPAGPTRDGMELLARLSRVGSYTATVGYAAPDSIGDIAACEDLCSRIGPSPQLLAALASIWAFHIVAGDLKKAALTLTHLDDLVQSPELERFGPEIEICRGHQLFFEGAFSQAASVLNSAAGQYIARVEGGEPTFWPLPNDPAVAALAIEACSRWIVGEHDATSRCIDNAIDLARTLPFPVGPFSMGYAGAYAAFVSHLAGDEQAAETYAQRVAEVGQQYGFGFWQVSGAVRLLEAGVAQVSEEEAATRAQQLRTMIGLWRAGGAELFQTSNLTSLAAAYRRAGQLESTLDCLAEALDAVTSRGERFHEAEIRRLQAEVMLELAPDSRAEAVAGLRRALDVAKSQEARSFQIRAAVSLVRARQAGSGDLQSLGDLREAIDAFPSSTPWAELDEARSLLAAGLQEPPAMATP